MKRHKLVASVCAFVCVLTLVIPAFAVTPRASEQIRSYMMDVIVTEGAVNIEFSIVGKNIMDKIGCQSIYLYERVAGKWEYVSSRSEDSNGMSNTKRSSHANTITFNGSAGVEYKVIVTVFAENDAGRDSRSQTFYVTGK